MAANNGGDNAQPLCRICFLDGTNETLCKPCGCAGSMNFVHASCLLAWIRVSSHFVCGICQHPFPVRQTPISAKQWLLKCCWYEKIMLLISVLTFLYLIPTCTWNSVVCLYGVVLAFTYPTFPSVPYVVALFGSMLAAFCLLITVVLFAMVSYVHHMQSYKSWQLGTMHMEVIVQQ